MRVGGGRFASDFVLGCKLAFPPFYRYRAKVPPSVLLKIEAITPSNGYERGLDVSEVKEDT